MEHKKGAAVTFGLGPGDGKVVVVEWRTARITCENSQWKGRARGPTPVLRKRHLAQSPLPHLQGPPGGFMSISGPGAAPG